MNIFGVSPVEIVIIAVLGLVIFGPERLPEVGRFLGRTVARVLAWQQTSPEAQLLAELRQDLEKEILEIRDELVRARQQLDLRSEFQDIQRETESLIKGQPILASEASNGVSKEVPTPSSPEAQEHLDQPAVDSTDATLTSEPPALPASDPLPESHSLSRSEVETLTLQMQAIMADLHALQEQLRQHGMLDPDWQPPSHAMQQENNVEV